MLDLYECETGHLDDIAWVKRPSWKRPRAAGATVVETVFHKIRAMWHLGRGRHRGIAPCDSHMAGASLCGGRRVHLRRQSVQINVANRLLAREFRSNGRCSGALPEATTFRQVEPAAADLTLAPLLSKV